MTESGDTQAQARWQPGFVASAWAAGYVPIHLYWAVTGRHWPVASLPTSLTDAEWRAANWGASVVISGAAVVSLALVQPWGRRLPRTVLLGVAGGGALISILHWGVISASIVLKMVGTAGGTVSSFDRWNLFVFEPWFLGMGVLLGVAVLQRLRDDQTSGDPLVEAHSPAVTVSTVLLLAGALVVLVGVMSFEVWLYALLGPGMLCAGVLLRLSRKSV